MAELDFTTEAAAIVAYHLDLNPAADPATMQCWVPLEEREAYKAAYLADPVKMEEVLNRQDPHRQFKKNRSSK